MNNSGGTGGGLLALILVGLAIWFFFIRVDYKDYWYDGSGQAWVQYCGQYGYSECDSHPDEYLSVYHTGKEKAASSADKYVHDFTIHFNNGGFIHAEGTCDKAASGRTYDRICKVTSYDKYGNWLSYIIHN